MSIIKDSNQSSVTQNWSQKGSQQEYTTIILKYDRLFATQKRKNPLSINYLTDFRNMAQWTGLEPATPGVTGRYSNQLNYHCAYFKDKWWVMTGSNRRPSACKADALPAELITLVSRSGAYIRHHNVTWQA